MKIPIQKAWSSRDIFVRMNFSFPSIDLSAEEMDILYFSNHSYDKEASGFVKRLLVDDVDNYETNVNMIAGIIASKFGLKWEKLANTLSLEYNPISNYDMEETETETRDLTRGVDETETHTHGKTESRVSSGTASNTNSVYGFNSDSAVPSDAQSGANGVTETVTHGGNDSDRTLGEHTEGGIVERTLNRSGNIGVTTSQQMIESEREVWQWDLINVIFADVDSILCLKIY